MISTQISRASTGFLVLGGISLLFAPDVVLPRIIPNFPLAGAWLGQLLGASWLSVASLNWLSQSALLGGIYSRSVVMANAVLYFIAATVLLKVVLRSDTPVALWFLFVPIVLFAGIYSWLLLRGPFERDLSGQRRA